MSIAPRSRARLVGSCHHDRQSGRPIIGVYLTPETGNLKPRPRACQRPRPLVRFRAMSTLLKELEWRGFVHHATPGLDAHLAAGPVTVYGGVGPPAPRLPLGNLMPLMLLRHFPLARGRPL